MHLAQVVTPPKQSGGGIKSIDVSTDFDEIVEKKGIVDKLFKKWHDR